ncbi:cupredoxin domain-containing protein [Saccharothrix variisporea]|nr:cupredoxin domain-containing protein [Saccharothrix variisporea]
MFSSGGRRRRWSRAAALGSALLLSLAAVGLNAPAATAATFTVSMQNLQYNPPTLNVQVGDTVRWTNNETNGVTHSVTGGPLSADVNPGESFSFTFTSAGTVNYRCRFHPDMLGSVVVNGTNPTTTTTPTSTTGPTTTTTVPTTTTTTSPPAPGPTTTTGSGGTPIGVGPVPVSFHLTDNQGSWYDTNLTLFGTRSLAVAELPRVKPGSIIPGLPLNGLPLLGNGALLGSAASDLLNGDLASLTQLQFNNGSPLISSLGVDPAQLLGLDNLRNAIGKVLSPLDLRSIRANTLITQLTQQMAARPANTKTNLLDLPVGVDLMKVLADIQAYVSSTTISLPVTVNFDISAPAAQSAHTITNLIWPEDAAGFPFDQPGAFVGSTTAQLTAPGLYAFVCKIHPYMLGAVVVDDPLTPGLDFGKKLRVNSRALNVPSDADIISQLVNKFFNITSPGNWQKFSNTEAKTWNPTFPPAPILMYDSNGSPQLVPILDAYFKNKFNTPKTLPALNQRPGTPGVGEVWIDTEMEKTASKTKSGTATKVDVTSWTVDRKVALPEVNMNNPHNMWTDKDERYIYQTEWFSNKLDVFERATGRFVRQVEVGPDPSHVMTRTDTDQLHVAINGGASVVELSPGGTKIDRRIPVQGPGEKVAHPHAHWMTGDGATMVTPNVNSYDSTIVDIATGNIRKEATGELPIATGITPDGAKAYEANFMGGTVSCISLKADACKDGGATVHNKQIDLWRNYDPVAGERGPFGGLPIQLPVSPDGNAVVVANTLSSNLTVIDPKTDEIVKWLPCDSGCHGINYGAKRGGGYYAYVSSKFANTLAVVDIDPNGDGSPSDAAVVGKMVLDPAPTTATDDPVVDYAGMGGMGVLAVPLVYNGWVQKVPSNPVNDLLTCRQRHPITYSTDC